MNESYVLEFDITNSYKNSGNSRALPSTHHTPQNTDTNIQTPHTHAYPHTHVPTHANRFHSETAEVGTSDSDNP